MATERRRVPGRRRAARLAGVLFALVPMACHGTDAEAPGPWSGEWALVRACVYEGVTGAPCADEAPPLRRLTLFADGRASDSGPPRWEGRYRVETRPLGGGRSETTLALGDRPPAQVTFAGDTLVLGWAYLDGPDWYLVRVAPGS